MEIYNGNLKYISSGLNKKTYSKYLFQGKLLVIVEFSCFLYIFALGKSLKFLITEFSVALLLGMGKFYMWMRKHVSAPFMSYQSTGQPHLLPFPLSLKMELGTLAENSNYIKLLEKLFTSLGSKLCFSPAEYVDCGWH